MFGCLPKPPVVIHGDFQRCVDLGCVILELSGGAMLGLRLYHPGCEDYPL